MSQAVSHIQQEGPSSWNNEYQWGNNGNQQPQQPAAAIFIRQPFNMASVQTQQPQQQQPIFFPQQVRRYSVHNGLHSISVNIAPLNKK